MLRTRILFSLLPAFFIQANTVKSSSLFIKNCQECHNSKKRKGKFSLTDLNGGVNPKNIQKWHDVLDQLKHHEMPPEDEKEISPKNREIMINWAKKNIASYNSKEATKLVKTLPRRLTLN